MKMVLENGRVYVDEPHSVIKLSRLIPEAASALLDVSPDDYAIVEWMKSRCW